MEGNSLYHPDDFSVLRNAGVDLIDVGKTLNANRWQRFRYIILPMISPSLAASSLIVFAYTFGAFEVPYLLGQTYPMLLSVWAYKRYADIDLMARPEGIATGMLIALIVTLSVVLSHIIDGLHDSGEVPDETTRFTECACCNSALGHGAIFAILLWSFSQQWFYPRCCRMPGAYEPGNTYLERRGANYDRSDSECGALVVVAGISVAIAIPAGRVVRVIPFPGEKFDVDHADITGDRSAAFGGDGAASLVYQAGLADSFLGVVLVHLTMSVPYAAFVMWGVFPIII